MKVFVVELGVRSSGQPVIPLTRYSGLPSEPVQSVVGSIEDFIESESMLSRADY